MKTNKKFGNVNFRYMEVFMSAVSGASSSNSQNSGMTSKKAIGILSIDGGGVRGLIPIEVIKAIEFYTGHSVTKLFDVFAGTSIGAIIAGGLNVRDPKNREKPKYSDKEFGEVMKKKASTIFPHGVLADIKKVANLLIKGSLYSSDGINSVSGEIFGGFLMQDTIAEVLATTTKLKLKTDGSGSKGWYTKIFSSSDCKKREKYHELALGEVCKASAAAPIYMNIDSIPQEPGSYFMDGGVLKNNPAFAAYLATVRSNPEDKINILSLGTGVHDTLTTTKELNANIVPKALGVVSIFMNGASENEHRSLAIEQKLKSKMTHYTRFQVELPLEDASTDDSSDANLKKLIQHGKQLVRDNAFEIQTFCDRLMKAKSLEKIGTQTLAGFQ